MHLHPLRVFHCRTFSTTAPRPLFLLPEILSTAHDLATTIHTTTSLPYHTLIPLSAVLLRLSVTTPLTISSRAAALRAQRLQPLLSAYQHPIARAAKLSTADPAAWERQTRSETRKLAREVRRRWRCQTWKIVIAPLVQLPVWLTASVTLRAMTGAPGAWWGFGGGEEFVEPTLSTEGALWFQDLLLEDPYLLLPMGFSVLLFANIEMQTMLHPPKTRNQRVFTNVLRAVSLAAFPLTAHAPAALTLYWCTSAMFSLVQNAVLAKVMPRREEVLPCKMQDPYRVEGGEGKPSSSIDR